MALPRRPSREEARAATRPRRDTVCHGEGQTEVPFSVSDAIGQPEHRLREVLTQPRRLGGLPCGFTRTGRHRFSRCPTAFSSSKAISSTAISIEARPVGEGEIAIHPFAANETARRRGPDARHQNCRAQEQHGCSNSRDPVHDPLLPEEARATQQEGQGRAGTAMSPSASTHSSGNTSAREPAHAATRPTPKTSGAVARVIPRSRSRRRQPRATQSGQ